KQGTVTLTGVQISDVAMGVEAIKGNLTISGESTIQFKNGAGNYGVKVGELVTMASLTDVKIMGKGSGKGVWMEGKTLEMTDVDVSEVGVGVWVKGGTLTISGGTMTGVQTGIDMSGSGKLVVRDGAEITFEGAGSYGVRVGSGVESATLTDVKIMGTGSGQGTGVIMNGAEMTISGGSISNVEKGVEATGGRLTIKGGTTIEFTNSGMENYGVKVGSGVTKAELTKVTIRGMNGNGTGVYVEGGTGTLMMEDVTIKDVSEGVWVKGTGALVMNKGEIGFMGEEGGYGVMVGKLVESATLTDVTIKGTDGQGMGVVMGGKMLKMERGSISNVELGVLMMGVGEVTLNMDDVTISDVAMGVLMKGAGTLTINKGAITFKGGEKNYGIGVWGKATATITGTTITGEGSGKGAMGVYATGMGTVNMTSVHISGVKMGVYAMEAKTMTISGGSISEV
ncbi:right-handed parallel beta-helix repeat-containing protein, partial [Bartonella bovis]|uniref:right-handed parallel beta-helix repeat-containing protein n=1 Tax=Bartonella bovis TaxID=155194 RepID=UPI001304B1A7